MSIKSLYPDTRPSLNLDFANTKVLDPRITFARASTATYVDSKGILQTAPTNSPRFDHDISTGESLGLLIEEARTNFVFGSGGSALYAGYNFSAESIWTITAASTDVTAPDGSTTTTKAVAGSTGTTFFWRYANAFSHASNTTYTQSVWIRVASGTGSIGLSSYPFGQSYYTNSITTQWQRISVTYTTDSGPSVSPYMGVVSPSSNTTFYLWGWQIEQGAFPTSYIPTTSSAVGRAADEASMSASNLNTWYKQTEGTLFGSYRALYSQNNDAVLSIYNTGASGNNRISFRPQNIIISTNGSLVASFTPNFAAGSSKIALGYQTDNTAYYYNGLQSGTTDTSVSIPNNLNFMTIGKVEDSPIYFNGHLKKISYYPKRISNTQLQALTQL